MDFPDIDEVQEILEELSQNIPEAFYDKLNLGIALHPEVKEHPQGYGNLYIMGTYHVNAAGCGISIYYGSFKQVYSYLSRERLREELDKTLRHEFWHHMEYRAGENALERQDEKELADYHHEYTAKKEG